MISLVLSTETGSSTTTFVCRDNTVTMTFTKLTINSGLDDKLFVFAAPKGVATVPLK